MSPASDVSDSKLQSDDDAVTEEQAEARMREYRKLAKAKPLSKDDKRRLGELHADLMNYRFTDPGRFDEKFQLISGQDPELVEEAPPDNLNTDADLAGAPQTTSNHFMDKGKGRYQVISQTIDRQLPKLTDIIGTGVRSQDEPEPVRTAVAWYSSNSIMNRQRRIYQIGSSDHYEIGKAKHWGPAELANLPELSGGNETILDIPMNSSPVHRQYNFNNIEVVAVVAPYSGKASHKSRPRELLTRPIYVLIKWRDILPRHLKHSSLMGDCKSFILKSKLLGTVSKANRITLNHWIENVRGQIETEFSGAYGPKTRKTSCDKT